MNSCATAILAILLGWAWASPYLFISTWTSFVCLSACLSWTDRLP